MDATRIQLVTEDEASRILKCTVAALRRWRRERRGPRFVRLGRLVRYRESDLTEFVDQNTEGAVLQRGQSHNLGFDQASTLGLGTGMVRMRSP